jgi:hypothetical protein
MNTVLAIRLIGASHLLQPPLTALLARRLGLRAVFSGLPTVPAAIAANMGFASVVLPTSMGCLLAVFAEEVATGGGIRAMAWLLSAFWTWRLFRQQSLGSHLPRTWHATLSTIFVVQGPLLAALVAGCAMFR